MTGQRIGYVRVSSFDQNPERQLDGTQVDRTFTDKASGKDVKRPELEALTGFAQQATPWWFTAWTGWQGILMTCGGLCKR